MDEDEAHVDPIGFDPITASAYRGARPDDGLGELVGTAYEWEHGLEFLRWVVGGYDNPNGCAPLDKVRPGLEVSSPQPSERRDGLEVSGAAAVRMVYRPPGAGGLEVSGSTVPPAAVGPLRAGELEVSGAGEPTVIVPTPPPGGLQLGDLSLVVYPAPVVELGRGHLQVSGGASWRVVVPVVSRGGLETTADVLPRLIYRGEAAGGLESSGVGLGGVVQVGPSSGQLECSGGGDATVAFPVAYGCHCWAGANTSLPNGSATPLSFDTESDDVGGWHSVVTNPQRLTVPTGFAGRVLVQGSAEVSGATSVSLFYLAINRYNSAGVLQEQRGSFDVWTGGAAALLLAASGRFVVAAADYFTLSVLHSSTGTVIANTSQPWTWFAVSYLGA